MIYREYHVKTAISYEELKNDKEFGVISADFA